MTTADQPAALETSGLEFSHDGKTDLRFADFACRAGEHWLLLGHSGSGKTTLLHLLGGLLRPSKGSISVAGTDVGRLSGAALDKFRGQKIGIVFQQSHFVRSLTVGENLAVAQKMAGLKADPERIRFLLEKLQIASKINKKPNELSVGEQQRAAIARAVVNRPAIILADEPTSALDDQNAAEVIELLENEAREVGATLLIVTHDGRLKSRFERKIELN